MASSTDPSAPPTVLVTRPAEDAAELSNLLEAAGFGVMPEPLLTIEALTPETGALAGDLEGAQALLFTSANGVRAFARLNKARELPAFCVGPSTAEAARLAGFAKVETAGGDVAALAALVTDSLKPGDGALFHAAGSDLAGDLAGRLEAAGFETRKRALYRAVAAEALSAEARAAIADGAVAAVVLFSPRTARTFAALMTEAGLAERAGGLTAACLSPAVAEALGGLTFHRTVIADRPEAADLVSALSVAEGVRVRADETPPDSGEKADRIGDDETPAPAPRARQDGGTEGDAMSDDKKTDGATTDDARHDAKDDADTMRPADAGDVDGETDADGNAAAAPHPGTPTADAVIDAFGGIRPMANRLDVAVSTVQGWKSRNHIPESRWRDVIAAASAAGVDLAKLTDTGDRPDSDSPDPTSSDTASSEDDTRDSPWDDDDRADARAEDTDGDAADVSAPSAREEKTDTTRPAKSGGGFAALIALIAILAVVTEPYWRGSLDPVLDPVLGQYKAEAPGAVDPARIEALAERIADLGGRVEDVAAQASEALQAGGGAGIDPAALDALRQRVAALESAAPGDGGRVDSAMLESEIDALAARLDEALGSGAIATLRDRVAAVESRVAGLSERVEEVAAAPALRGAQQAAVVIAVGSVQDALAAGRSFEAPLQRVARLAPEDPALADAVAALEPFAPQGVATRSALQRRFEADAAAMHAAIGGDEGWVDETVGRLTSLVSVRQKGEAADRPPVSRAEAALVRGDLAGAVAALSEIRESSPAADAWLTDAEARLQAEAAVDALREAAVARLSTQTGGAD